ncbi:hypothetical protein HGM15179_000667 [Zosterops borbonicus]|uniref:Rna-directed dna polymerase from mobile element jockey-like n=1 Tax=Zosterops borbonicus TaxID=364589 RepID=A0A8K1LTQ1_9PASS|nr:hypothetical protein HGM15179_000667 [Zosterops borbonicus]
MGLSVDLKTLLPFQLDSNKINIRVLAQTEFCPFILINDIDKGAKCIFSKFVDDTNTTHVFDTNGEWDIIQRELDKLEKWVHGNIMRFEKIKCKVLHQSQDNCCYQHSLGDGQIKRS